MELLKRLLRLCVGIAAIPLCVAVSRAALNMLRLAQTDSAWLVPPSALAMAGGFFAWLLLFCLLPQSARSYVLAHELTHALWAALMGARVLSIRVARESGSVTVSKSNFLVVLAPYFFPFYTVLIVAAYYLLALFIPVDRFYLLWLALVGFTWSFHVTFTITTLAQHQSDIRRQGRLFSYGAIYFFNVLGACAWIVIVSDATLEELVASFAENALWVVDGVRAAAHAVFRAAPRGA